MRQLISSGSVFEPIIGFSRAVRIGPFLSVSGTGPIGQDGKTEGSDAYEQTKRCLEIILAAVEQSGLQAESVIRTRVFLVDINTWEDAARAHREVFGELRPACTFLQVSRFIGADWLVEIEADCVDLSTPI